MSSSIPQLEVEPLTTNNYESFFFSHYRLDPFIIHKSVSGVSQTRALFAHNSRVLLVGNAKGEVSVYMPRNVPLPPSNKV